VAFTNSRSEQDAFQLARKIASAGGKALALKADSASVEGGLAAVLQAVEAFGELDIIVTNAGIPSYREVEGGRIGSVTDSGQRSSFSNYGTTHAVFLVAPGRGRTAATRG
jgi:NAD(P)-dependent dehydrogenase (short-subunit alcohol dehydrogenase family)